MNVDLDERAYDIVLGELNGLGAEVLALGVRRCVLVTNDVVSELHLETARASLVRAGLRVDTLVIPDGERLKNRDTWWSIVEGLLAVQVDRKTPVVSLGGGVTGDLVGFAAASVLRGLPFVQVPTTLLAMVDASVGGKTGFNTAGGKNLVGAFHQPRFVFAPLDTLSTLSDAEFRCGLGEVVKHAVIADPELLEWLVDERAAVLGRDRAALTHIVRRCCEIKAAVVVEDERESGVRAVLNCGHTIGHALERVLGYGALRHGEAVGIGLVGEAAIAVGRGEAEASLPSSIGAALSALGLPIAVAGVEAAAVAAATAMDKKRERGIVRVAYPVKIGEVRIAEVERAELRAAAATVTHPEEP
ncbi:MAG: 3-dehydroquinate synthase [Proteobacteria bacterium]|nr:3-dehydroquinate synthase [Pseudomonadota bacterium]